MKFLRRSSTSFRSLWIAVVIVAAILGLDTWRISVASQVRELDASELQRQVSACIPDSPFQIENVDLAGYAAVDDRDYYYLYAYQGEIPENPEAGDTNFEGYPSNLVISTAGGQCRMDHFNPMNDPIPLAQTVPQEAARELTLDRYQRTIAQIGRDELQERIDSWDTGAGGLWDEEKWALKQLGMDIPAGLL
jgi:hypothetical protein